MNLKTTVLGSLSQINPCDAILKESSKGKTRHSTSGFLLYWQPVKDDMRWEGELRHSIQEEGLGIITEHSIKK